MENRCVVCGVIIPEGRYVCPCCETGYRPIPDNKKQERMGRVMSEKKSIEFTGEQFDMIMDYMKLVDAVTVQVAILNAICIATDRVEIGNITES